MPQHEPQQPHKLVPVHGHPRHGPRKLVEGILQDMIELGGLGAFPAPARLLQGNTPVAQPLFQPQVPEMLLQRPGKIGPVPTLPESFPEGGQQLCRPRTEDIDVGQARLLVRGGSAIAAGGHGKEGKPPLAPDVPLGAVVFQPVHLVPVQARQPPAQPGEDGGPGKPVFQRFQAAQGPGQGIFL